MLTESEIIEKLIARDNRVTQEFFGLYQKEDRMMRIPICPSCEFLLRKIIRDIFYGNANYFECVTAFYEYLMTNDKLRQIEERNSLFGWIKVTAVRFFLARKEELEMNDKSQEDEYETVGCTDEEDSRTRNAHETMMELLDAMPNQRYAYVLLKLVVEDLPPEDVADMMSISVDNLYNIKRRAIKQLTEVALKDREYYERF